jgi:hypothetical protein
MCKDTKVGKRWEYRADSLVPSFTPKIILICKKCAYRENYGSKFSKKAVKQKLLEKINYNFNASLPKVED